MTSNKWLYSFTGLSVIHRYTLVYYPCYLTSHNLACTTHSLYLNMHSYPSL